jgi:hypothetical protein
MLENYSTFWMAGSLCAIAGTALSLEREMGEIITRILRFVLYLCAVAKTSAFVKELSLRNTVTEKVAGCRYQYTLVLNDNAYMSISWHCSIAIGVRLTLYLEGRVCQLCFTVAKLQKRLFALILRD